MENKEIKKRGGILRGRTLYRIIIVLCTVLGLGYILYQSGDLEVFLGQRRYEKISEDVKVESTQPETEEQSITVEETKEAYVSPIDFEKLWEVNEDIVAWVSIPNTNIDYPILWNGDNDYYLKHDVDKNESIYGAIYLDMDDKPDFSSMHNVLYGHNMRNKSMFAHINLFKDKDFFNENRDVYVYTPEKTYHLKTIAALYTDASGEKRRTDFYSQNELKEYTNKMIAGADIKELPEGDLGQLWSFVTCSYEFSDARTILYAYEVKDEESEPIEETAASMENASVNTVIEENSSIDVN